MIKIKKFFGCFFKKSVRSPNILLTNFCNQACPYCFAQQEMASSKIRELSLKDFKRLVEILKREEIRSLRLMGGEPTLHSHFEEIVKIGVGNFNEVVIFTNGVIPEEVVKVLKKNLERLIFNFNINAPEFEKSGKARKKIIRLIKNFSQKTEVNIGFTLSDLKKDYRKLFSYFDRGILTRLGVRFGIAKAIIGQKPFFSSKDCRKLGRRIIELVKFFQEKEVQNIFLDCGLQKRMFSKKELRCLENNVRLKGWGCEGKWSSFDIAPDLTIFPCFPYYKKMRRKLGSFKDFLSIVRSFEERKSCLQI